MQRAHYTPILGRKHAGLLLSHALGTRVGIELPDEVTAKRAWMRCTKGESEVSQRSRRSSAICWLRLNTRALRRPASRWNSGCAPSCSAQCV